MGGLAVEGPRVREQSGSREPQPVSNVLIYNGLSTTYYFKDVFILESLVDRDSREKPFLCPDASKLRWVLAGFCKECGESRRAGGLEQAWDLESDHSPSPDSALGAAKGSWAGHLWSSRV